MSLAVSQHFYTPEFLFHPGLPILSKWIASTAASTPVLGANRRQNIDLGRIENLGRSSCNTAETRAYTIVSEFLQMTSMAIRIYSHSFSMDDSLSHAIIPIERFSQHDPIVRASKSDPRQTRIFTLRPKRGEPFSVYYKANPLECPRQL